MPNKSKAKGNRFERKIVECCQAHNIPAVRAWGSNGRSIGMHEEVDVLIDNTVRVQAKVRAKLPQYIVPTDEVDIQVIKQDRGELLVVMKLDDWLTDYRAMMELTNRA